MLKFKLGRRKLQRPPPAATAAAIASQGGDSSRLGMRREGVARLRAWAPSRSLTEDTTKTVFFLEVIDITNFRWSFAKMNPANKIRKMEVCLSKLKLKPQLSFYDGNISGANQPL